MKKLDLIILIVVFAASAAAFLIAERASDEADGKALSGRYAEIYVKNELTETIDLREDRLIEVESADGYNLVEVKDGSVRMREADCFSQTCVHTGAKSGGGDMIVCLPNRVVVKIAGAPEEVDVVAR